MSERDSQLQLRSTLYSILQTHKTHSATGTLVTESQVRWSKGSGVRCRTPVPEPETCLPMHSETARLVASGGVLSRKHVGRLDDWTLACLSPNTAAGNADHVPAELQRAMAKALAGTVDAFGIT